MVGFIGNPCACNHTDIEITVCTVEEQLVAVSTGKPQFNPDYRSIQNVYQMNGMIK